MDEDFQELDGVVPLEAMRYSRAAPMWGFHLMVANDFIFCADHVVGNHIVYVQ